MRANGITRKIDAFGRICIPKELLRSLKIDRDTHLEILAHEKGIYISTYATRISAEAINKIKLEMTQNNTNSYIQVVGEFLLQHLDINMQDAEKMLDVDKTISKSLDEIKKETEKRKIGNCTDLTKQEGYNIILTYFEINEKADRNVIMGGLEL